MHGRTFFKRPAAPAQPDAERATANGHRPLLSRKPLEYLVQRDIFAVIDQPDNEHFVSIQVRSVGVMGDSRTYDYACALRAVTSTDGMTADVFPFDMSFLTRVGNRIVNEVRGINRVTYDITSKPPGTIEWE